MLIRMEEDRKESTTDKSPEEHKEHMHEHQGHHEHHEEKESSDTLKFAIIGALFIILIVQMVMVSQLKGMIAEKKAAADAAAKPAILTLMTIADSQCTSCTSLDPVISDLKKKNVKVENEKSVEFSSQGGKDLITQYGIQNVPSVIVTGEIDKVSVDGFKKNADALVYSQEKPPYRNVVSDQIDGLVTVTQLVDKTCTNCTDFTSTIQSLKKVGVGVTSDDVVDISSTQGKNLMQKYKIERVPTIIMSNGIKFYPQIVQSWPEIGSVESDGNYIMRSINPPYKNLSTGKIDGLVTLTYLVDSKCTSCYDVKRHKQILQDRYHVFLKEEKTVDVSSKEGAALVDKYKIKSAPTILISKEIADYPNLGTVWQQVGSVESDGTYVFRDVSVMNGDYRNLETNEIVKPAPVPQPASA